MKTKTTNKTKNLWFPRQRVLLQSQKLAHSLLPSIFIRSVHPTRQALVPFFQRKRKGWKRKGESLWFVLSIKPIPFSLSPSFFVCSFQTIVTTDGLIHWFQKKRGIYKPSLKKTRGTGPIRSYIISFFGCSLNTFALPKSAVRVGKRGG